MRLAKHLAHAGVASRRAAEQLVFDGRVTVEGEVVRDPARDVDGSEEITVDGARVGQASGKRVVYMVHKPAGVVSTAKDTHGRPVVTDMVRVPRRLYPVGRLDADTTGLILLTDDGALAHRLTHPSFEVPKTYLARVRGGTVPERLLQQLRDGVELDDGMTAPARVKQVEPGLLEITIHEGRKRQVRRMCDAIGHRVEKLERIAFGPLRLGDLKLGKHRELSGVELEKLRKAGTTPGPSTAHGRSI